MAPYPDTELYKEFILGGLGAATKTYVASIWTAAGSTGPLYKWVRINAGTKQSLKANVDNTGLAAANAANPLYYDSGLISRSGERRVGEECRSRWSPYHLKKKRQKHARA